MTTIQVTRDGERVVARAPYHPEWPAQAKALGGRYRPTDKSWQFDARDEARVRELCVAIYGTDGETAADLVTLHVQVWRLQDSQAIWLAGREICSRPGRDAQVRLGAGVILLSGEFAAWSGSRNHPRVGALAGTILEVRDVPRPLAEAEAQKLPEIISIIEHQGPDREALRAERERLTARIAEIDKLLSE